MASPFTAKKLNVPGLLSDEALQEQLKQFGDTAKAKQGAAPMPDSAFDLADKVQRDYLAIPASKRTPPPQRPLSIAQRRTPKNVASEFLDSTLRGGPAAGVGRVLGTFGTLTPAEQVVEADNRAEDLRESEEALRAHDEMRRQLRNLTETEAAEQLGQPTPPSERNKVIQVRPLQPPEGVTNEDGSTSTERTETVHMPDGSIALIPTLWTDGKTNAGFDTAEAIAAAALYEENTGTKFPRFGSIEEANEVAGERSDKGGTGSGPLAAPRGDNAAVQSITKRRKLAEAAVRGEAPKPTQKWWLNAMQVGARSAAQTGTAALKYPPIVYEQMEALVTGSSEKSKPREWLDAVDKSITAAMPGDKARSTDFVTGVSQGAGSFSAFLVAGYAGSAVGVPARAAAGILGGAVGGVQAVEDAERFDATGLQKYFALLAGTGLGMAEAIPIDRMLMRADAGTGGLIRRLLQNTTASSMEEFIQETSQAIGEDVIAKYGVQYDPERDLDPRDWLRQGAIGAITGAGGGVVVTGLASSGVTTSTLTPDVVKEQAARQVLQTVQGDFDRLGVEGQRTGGTVTTTPVEGAEVLKPVAESETVEASQNTGAPAPGADRPTATQREAFIGEQTRPAEGIPGAPAVDQNESVAKISENFIRLMDLTARQGRFTLKGREIMGQYSRNQAVVRLRTWNDLSTLVHEGGHALHDAQDKASELQKFSDNNKTVLKDIAQSIYGGDIDVNDAKKNSREGFAEFVRVYTLNRKYAENNYPKLTKEFTELLDNTDKKLAAGLDMIGQQFAAYLQMPSAQVVRNMVVSPKNETGMSAALKEIQDTGFNTWMQAWTDKTMEQAINKQQPLNRLVTDMLNLGEVNTGEAVDLKRADDPRILMRLAKNSGARGMVQITDGVIPYRSVHSTTRGLREALAISQGYDSNQNVTRIDDNRQQDFDAYLVALRSLDEYRRLSAGEIQRPPIGATQGDIEITINEMETKYGEAFTKAAEVVHEYGMALWKKQFEAGLMAEATYQDGLTRRFYAPLQRDMSDKKAALGESAVTGGQSIVKRFKGSDRDIVSPLSVLMQKTFALEKIIAQNDVARALARLSDKAGQAGAMVERIPATKMLGKQFTVKEVAQQLTKDNSITDMDAQDLMSLLEASIEDNNVLTMFRSEQASGAGENVIFYWDKGKVAALQLKDGEIGADIVNLMNAVGRENMGFGMELLAGTTTAFRTAITSWPDFLVVNFIRDQMSAWILTDVGFKPFVSGLRGVGDEIRQTKWAKMYNAAMGTMGGINVATMHDARVNRDLNALRGKGYLTKAFSGDGARGAVKGFARVIELSETGTRLGIFKKAFEKAKGDGLTDYEAAVEAGYTATDYIDFGMHGSAMLHARRLIPFLNAQLQGWYKMLRTLGGDEVRQRKGLKFALGAFLKTTRNMPLSRAEKAAVQTGRRAWVKMSVLGIMSAALHFLYEDDPDYQETSEYLRQTGWVIPTGEGRIVYIPKPFELALMANAVERGLEAASGDTEAKNRFMRGVVMAMAPPTSPPAIQVMVEHAANKDFFSGREIVPSYMQALQPQLQFNNYTSDLAKGIGQATGMSPMIVDHYLSGLGASAYRDVKTLTNAVNPERPSMDATDAPLTRRFIRDTRRGSASAKDFWNQASMMTGRLQTAANTYKAMRESGNEIAANAMLDELPADEKAFALLNTHFKADAKRLNPFYRGRQVTRVVSAMRREISSDLGLDNTSKFADAGIQLTAREKADVDEVLSEIARREVRNTLVATDTDGWRGKQQIEVEATVDLLREVEPRVADELERRYKKSKIYDADAVFENWPETRDRLIADREEAFLKDIVQIVKVQ